MTPASDPGDARGDYGGARLGELALDTLHGDVDDLLADLDHGVTSRPHLVVWCHKASARTLGQLPDEWAVDLLASRYRTAALLDDPGERDAMLDRAPDERRARLERQLVGGDRLLASYVDAMRLLADQADEYQETDVDGALGPQKWLAMRPTLDDLVTRQRRALERALGLDDDYPDGLATVGEVDTWVRAVVRATRGDENGLTHAARWSPYWRELLLGDPSSPTLHLELADAVLAPMNRQLRQLATASTEALAEDRPTPESFST